MADGLSIDIDTSEIAALLKKFPQFEAIIFNEMETAMMSSMAVLEAEIAGQTPVNTGALAGSINHDVDGQNGQLIGTVGTAISYGEPVEFGRAAGKWPPIDAIELWVRRKLGIGGNEARSVAFLVARKIGQQGTDGAAMFEKGFDAGKPSVEKLWRNVPPKAIAKIEGKLT